MKKVYVLFLIILSLMFFAGCTSKETSETQFDSKRLTFENDFIDVNVYNASSGIFEDLYDVFSKYYRIFDETKEYESVENVFTLNQTKEARFDHALIEKLNEINQINSELGNVSFLSKGLKDIWTQACLSSVLPEKTTLEFALKEEKESSLIINGDTVKINGNAMVSLQFFKKSFILNEFKKYFESKKLKIYYINYNSETFLFGENINDTLYEVFPYNVSNGFINIKNQVISTVTSDFLNVIDEKGNKYTNIVDCSNGNVSPNFTKLFVITSNIIISDVLANSYFNSNIETITRNDLKYNTKTIAYNWINLSYKTEDLEVISK